MHTVHRKKVDDGQRPAHSKSRTRCPRREGARNLDNMVDDVVHVFLARSRQNICVRNMGRKRKRNISYRKIEDWSVNRRTNSRGDLEHFSILLLTIFKGERGLLINDN